MRHAVLVALLAVAFAHAAGAAGPFRCDGKLIRPGVSATDVLARCGRPDYGVSQAAPVRARNAAGFSRFIGVAVSEQWVYDRGFGRFPALLIIHDGRLRRIEFLSDRS